MDGWVTAVSARSIERRHATRKDPERRSFRKMSVNAPKTPLDPRYVYLDSYLVDEARLNLGLSRKDFAVACQVPAHRLAEMFNGGGLQAATAKKVADYLGKKVTDLLAAHDPLYRPRSEPTGPSAGAAEWQWICYLDQGRLTPNGLYYIVSQMQHRHTQGKYARGKYYHLGFASDAKREEMRHQLSRHADVCARVGVHPNIAVNLASAPTNPGDGWWVIDHWVGEHSLADRLASGPWPTETLPKLLLDIATGIQTLHAADVLLRELSPSRILIDDVRGHAVLTDFELAKLLDGSPSVSSDWPEDPFRAPELDGGSATVRSDLYSFGQTAVAAAGSGNNTDSADKMLQAVGCPKRLQGSIIACLEPLPTKRPADLSTLVHELHRWATR